MQDEISEISDRMLDRAAAIAKEKGDKKRASMFTDAAEKKREAYHRAYRRGEVDAERHLEAYDPTAEFADNVMREAFDKMTKGELKDYDSKSLKPGSQGGHRRDATKAEREEMAAKFRARRRGPGPGTLSVRMQKLADLRKP